jgi:putative serine protease PepD
VQRDVSEDEWFGSSPNQPVGNQWVNGVAEPPGEVSGPPGVPHGTDSPTVADQWIAGQSVGSRNEGTGMPQGEWSAGSAGQPVGPQTPQTPQAPQAPQPEWGGEQPRNEWARPTEQVLFGSAVGQQGGGGGTPPGGNYLIRPPQPMPQREPQQARRGGGGLVVGVAVLALLVGGGAGALGGYLVADSSGSSAANALDQKTPAEQTSSAPAGSVEAVAAKVSPSVVQLEVQSRSSAGEGSGFIISADGLIMTNNHVVESAAEDGKITAVFADGSTATATIVGRDPTSDVAVVKAEGKSGLPIVDLGSSEALKVGQGVVAIGSPFELSGTVTSGIVSSLHRPTRAGGEDGSQTTVMDAIQTDAAINPGNSGGPLVNMQGQVIGINSAIYSPQSSAQSQGGSVGIGFSIPIDQARRTAKEITDTGKATQTVLGVSVRDNQDGGALVADVTAGGAGEKAGLKAGDVITKLDDRRIDTSDALVAAVRSHAPGDKVRLELSNGSRTVEATLAGQTVETG